MEGPHFFKFWKQSSSHNEADGEEGDDSFFELEFSTAKMDSDKNVQESYIAHDAADSISKRKILPIEPLPKPQSPISLLKSAPSLKALTFKKSKSIRNSEMDYGCATTPMRVISTPLRESNHRSDSFSSREVAEESRLGKYLSLIRLFYVKISGKPVVCNPPPEWEPDADRSIAPCQSPGCGSRFVETSPRKLTRGSVIQVACKKLGRGKPTAGANPRPASARRDDNLVLQNDGIQGAILYCKKSFNSSKDSAVMSRFGHEALGNEKQEDDFKETK